MAEWIKTTGKKEIVWTCNDKYSKLSSVTLNTNTKICKTEFTTRITNDLKKVYDHNKGESKNGCEREFINILLRHHFITEDVHREISKELSKGVLE